MTRKRICARSLAAGPGSCWFWWDGCPANVAHCWQRFVRENAHLCDAAEHEQKDAASQWQAARDKALFGDPKLL